MKLRFAAPSLLVDLKNVPDLAGISRDGDGWRIGAMTKHAAVAREKGLGLLARAASTIADPQVRNRGTIGGSVAHGDPASDMPALLMAAEASIVAVGGNGQREIPAVDFFEDYLTTALAEDEVLTEIRVPSMDAFGWG